MLWLQLVIFCFSLFSLPDFFFFLCKCEQSPFRVCQVRVTPRIPSCCLYVLQSLLHWGEKNWASPFPFYFHRDKFTSWGPWWLQNTHFQAVNVPCKSSAQCNKRNGESIFYISRLLMKTLINSRTCLITFFSQTSKLSNSNDYTEDHGIGSKALTESLPWRISIQPHTTKWTNKVNSILLKSD